MSRVLFAVFAAAAALLVTSCVSNPAGKDYNELSKAETFSYYFPEATVSRQFDTIEEAYDYVSTARAKLALSVGKGRAQGLSAKLIGPSLNAGTKVTVAYFVTADSGELSGESGALEGTLRKAVSVSSVFLVFYHDRGAAISDFYLQDGYRYSSNAQYESYRMGSTDYQASYPVGWGVDKAFKYVSGEIE